MQTETLAHPGEETVTAVKSKVLLVDDHPIVRQGLGMLIDEEPDLIVCGQAEDIEAALSAITNLKPDVVIVDIFLKEESGVDLIKQIHQRWPALPMLVLSMHRETLHAERVLRAGAKGYIMKQEATQNIMRAIRQVLTGQIFVSERMASRLLSKAVDSSNPRGGGPLERLSDREFEVFTLIGQGLGPTEMSNRLSVSVKTIETHRENIKAKLGLKNGTALVRYAMEYAMGEKLGREDEAPPAV
jgi:DNA-binding NarL/FixJ family response regulator